MLMSLEYSAVFVAIADRADEMLVKFYSQVFGIPPNPYLPHVYAEFQLAGLRLGVFQPKAEHQAEFAAATSGSVSLCIEVACWRRRSPTPAKTSKPASSKRDDRNLRTSLPTALR
ncbi:MAG: hypothetical protein HC881_16580 [Leptolyngbyaceae cyanobacterium SL_7_1]|nr:hypothetical protein [Leptolyngbyaceae cyanobacterium SL_7_1]